MKTVINFIRSLFLEAFSVFKDLLVILVPAIVVVKILKEVGVVDQLSTLLEPTMSLFGLPGEMSVVMTTAVLTNLYGSIAVFPMVAGGLELSAAQATVLSTFVLIAHALPIELALTHRVGGHFLFLGALRLIGACVAGLLLNFIYSVSGTLQGPATIILSEAPKNVTLTEWALEQAENLGFIFLVLFCLLALMRLLNQIGFTKLLGTILKPLLLVMGISSQAASIAVFGLLAGITFGSGLLLAEIKSNKLPAKDIVLVLAFLSLCHGVIEDTALMLLFGGHLSGILFFRLIFAIVILVILSRLSFIDFSRLSTRE